MFLSHGQRESLSRAWSVWADLAHTPSHCSQVQTILYLMQCAVCSMLCLVYSALCTVLFKVCSVQCAVCSVQCAVFSVQCAVCSVQCAVCSVQCAVQFLEQILPPLVQQEGAAWPVWATHSNYFTILIHQRGYGKLRCPTSSPFGPMEHNTNKKAAFFNHYLKKNKKKNYPVFLNLYSWKKKIKKKTC